MEIFRVNRATAEQARGVVIVIDVIRAFTVAGYAFAGGAEGLWLVRTIEDAQALRKYAPETLFTGRPPKVVLAGEVGGRLIPGFDLNNSPARMANADVRGRLLIQRTGAGTQGAVGASHASSILLCALTNAQATATYASLLAQETHDVITLLPTGTDEDFSYGNEDVICADYVEALLRGREDAPAILERGIKQLHTSGRFAPWEQGDADFPNEDIEAVLQPNRFDFAMQGIHKEWQGVTYVDVQRINLA